jgi:FecR protein
MTSKSSRFDFDWWIIQKRLIYIIIGVLALSGVAGGTGIYIWKYGSPFKGIGKTSDAPAGARFISFEGDVRVIRSATRETIVASSQTQLYPGDTVQTQADGRARISLADGSTLFVRPNSTVIVRDNTKVDDGQKVNVRVAVDRGQINVRTETQPAGTNNVVETPKTQNKLESQTGVSFGVNPDHTEDIRVNTGSIETTTANGEKTTVREGEYVAVNPTGALARRERLLDVPTLVGPRDLEKVFVGAGGAANVSLRWQRPAQGTPSHYRVEVATSPFFVAAGKVVERDQLISTEFNASDLRPGVYYWRVRAAAASGQASDWSEPQKFFVVGGGTGDAVSVSDWVVQYVGGNVYLIRGHTQPGNTIRITGRETLAASDGSFQIQITAPEGAREITVEAQDPQGNRNQYRLELSTGVARAKK